MPSEELYWLEPTGEVHNLNEELPKMGVRPGKMGFGLPPVEHITEQVPLRPGARHRLTKILPRQLDIPLHFNEPTYEEFKAKLNLIENWFYPDPDKGPGILRITNAQGITKEIDAYYQSGLQGNESLDSTGVNWQDAIITLLAPDPYFHTTAAIVTTYTLGTPATFFPLLPIKLTRTDIFSAPSVDNTGDVPTYPIWVITGPATNILLVNNSLTPARTIEIVYALADGETITIDTREHMRTVLKNDGSNLYGSLTNTSYLWPLLKGVNNLQIELEGATGSSSVRLDFYPRFVSGS